MAEVKRLNYFTAQALVEQDFDDEQAYHLNSNRQHNRLLHAGGVAEGLDVTLVSGKQVQVSAGMAIDNGGREIVLGDALTYSLATPGTDRDVFLTIAYQEVLDPADKDTQGLNKVLRTTERPLLQDGTVPPTDGSVVLARIHLNHAGAIDPNGSIDTSVRTRTSALVTPASITSTRLADGAVTLAKLADAVKPLSMRGTDAIRVDTDPTLKTITIGDAHSGRADNPHQVTATQINSQGSGNQLVSQINAGTGIINRANVESAIVSGVVTFENLAVGEEMFSNDIDPGFGPGTVYVQLALDNAAGPTSGGDTNYGRAVQLRSEVNRNTGRFRIFVTRNSGSPTGSVSVRWSAFEPIAGAVSTAAVGVAVSPSTANLHNATQVFTANVSNTNSTGVTWSIAEGQGVNAGGTLSATTGSSTTYTPPSLSGTYHVVATSTIDTTQQGTAAVVVVGDVAVAMSQTTTSVLLGATLNLSASVTNTDDNSVTWNVQETGGGTVSPATSTSATYTPTASGTFHVIATSNADSTKTVTCQITVPAVTIALDKSTATVFCGEPLSLSATVGNAANTGVSWSIQEGTNGGSIAVTTGSSSTYTAPLPAGTYHVIATSNADSNKKATCTITVPAVTIALNQTNVSVNRGTTLGLTATVGNTSNTGVTWSVQEAGGGSVSPTSGASTTYTPPNTTGTFHVIATSNADSTKTVTCQITVPAVTIALDKSTATVFCGEPLSLSATVGNAVDTGVSWSIQEGTNGGSISATTGSSATYTAPLPAGTYHVIATSHADSGTKATCTITVPAVTIALNQTKVSVNRGTTLGLAATVGNSNTGVTWSVQEAGGGSVSPTSGASTTYTPPNTTGTFHVIATSAADSTKTVTCEITVPAVTIALDKSTATVFRGEPLSLSATVGNAVDTGVSWSIQEGTNGGSISATTGSSVTYTAPLPAGTYHVIATSHADSGTKATCTITVPAVTIALNQTKVSVNPGTTLGLTATVGNTSNTGVTWSVQEAGGGSVSPASGTSTTYTPPSTAGTFHVIATSAADSTMKATCEITVVVLPVTIALNQTDVSMNILDSITLTATVSNTADKGVTWSVLDGRGSLSASSGTSVVYTAPGFEQGGSGIQVIATSHADPTKTATCNITAFF